jgi:threonine/homoserine/homoserine lactone efflux protein
VSARLRLPDGTRSAQSPWVWRGFLFMSLIALGFCLILAAGGDTLYAVAWGAITLSWLGFSMWLWRKNIRFDEVEWQRQQAAEKRPMVRGGHVS